MAYVIGCDLGSQSLKGVIVDPDGRIVATASAPYDLSFPHPGWAEQDPADWLRGLQAVIAQLLRSARIEGREIGAIGLASQVDGLVAVDALGIPLRPAIIWMDRRAEQQCRDLAERIDPGRIFAITGLNLDSSHVAPKILWLRDVEPEVYRTASALLLPGSYMVSHLTGRRVADYSNASSSMLYDVQTRSWSEEMLSAAGVDPALLGSIAPSDTVAGTLTRSTASELGLAPETKVVVGCGDEHGACLGAGLTVPHLICDITGTAEPIATASGQPVFDATGLVETHAHADPRLWLIENPGFVSGGSIRWYCDQIGHMDYEAMETAAAAAPAGSEGLIFLPCLSGAMTPTWNGNARGVFFGLSMRHGKAHLARATLEGCAYGFRDIVDRFAALGLGSEEIRVVGGGAKSALWCQIKASVSGRVLRTLENEEATAAGAAMLAGVAEGTYSSLDEAAIQLVDFDACYEPQPEQHAIYKESYARYRQLYSALEPIFG